MTNPQIKTQAKLHIYDGISVETVKQQGSDGQKIAVPLFDTNGNGKLEGMEVDRMNRCTFKSEKNKVKICKYILTYYFRKAFICFYFNLVYFSLFYFFFYFFLC